MTEILTRRKFEARPEKAEMNRDPYTRAKEILGYSPIAVKTEAQNNKRSICEQHVAKALETLGIEPMDRDAVEKYKRAKVDEIQSKGSNKFVKYMHTTKCEGLVIGLGFCTFVPLVILAIGLGAMADPHFDVSHPLFFKYTFGLISLPLMSWITCMIARHKKSVIYTGQWNAISIDAYEDPIREFALERALQVKAVLPESKFYIDVLHEEARNVKTEYKPAPPDPFLIMRYEHLLFYLDVWDEPGFEGRRTI